MLARQDLNRFAFALTAVAVATYLPADGSFRHYFLASPARSIKLLGTSDLRVGGYFHYQMARDDPRLSIRGHRGEFVWEGYAGASRSTTAGKPRKNSYSLGTLALIRHTYGSEGKPRWFWEAGWGIQGQTRVSKDLDSKLNSTPVLSYGWMLPAGKNEYVLALRLLHISNAGTKGHNRGQNQLLLMLGTRL